jgi:hypothetical protein
MNHTKKEGMRSLIFDTKRLPKPALATGTAPTITTPFAAMVWPRLWSRTKKEKERKADFSRIDFRLFILASKLGI